MKVNLDLGKLDQKQLQKIQWYVSLFQETRKDKTSGSTVLFNNVFDRASAELRLHPENGDVFLIDENRTVARRNHETYHGQLDIYMIGEKDKWSGFVENAIERYDELHDNDRKLLHEYLSKCHADRLYHIDMNMK